MELLHEPMCAVVTNVCLIMIPLISAYHAPLDIFVELNKMATDPKVHTLSTDKQVNVCVGKEWYRFPSSFFLPGPK